jgi:hypothetical protein
LTDHAGDDESFVITLVRSGSDWAFAAISTNPHRNAGVCEFTDASTYKDIYGHPHLWVGEGKHPNYVKPGPNCFGMAEAYDPGYLTEFREPGSTSLSAHRLINVGNPMRPLVTDLGVAEARWAGKLLWSERFENAGFIYDAFYLHGYYIPYAPAGYDWLRWYDLSGGCVKSLTVYSEHVAGTGGQASVTLNHATGGCAWHMETDVPWIVLQNVSNPHANGWSWPVSSFSGAGSATLSYSVLTNSGGARDGTIYIGGEVLKVHQDAGGPSGCGPLHDLGRDYLFGGDELHTSDQITSWSGLYRLLLQCDGNLVIYDTSSGIPMWSSGTAGSGVIHAIMQTDGNFVLYDAGYTPIWYTRTNGHPGAFLRIQDDSNLVVYDSTTTWNPLWAFFGL